MLMGWCITAPHRPAVVPLKFMSAVASHCAHPFLRQLLFPSTWCYQNPAWSRSWEKMAQGVAGHTVPTVVGPWRDGHSVHHHQKNPLHSPGLLFLNRALWLSPACLRIPQMSIWRLKCQQDSWQGFCYSREV